MQRLQTSITSSLESAVKAYREGRDHETYLWADAVSIDQANMSERAEQIPLMRQIYTKAAQVFVYLGAAERSQFQGLDIMFLLSILDDLSGTAAVDVKAIMQEIMPGPEHSCWDHFYDTFTSPWFRRTWILQEIALSKKATVCNGAFAVDWSIIESAYKSFTGSGLFFRIVGKGQDPHEGMICMMNLKVILRCKDLARSPHEASLGHILSITGRFQVSDPRDKIVGVLGFMGEVPESLKSLVNPELTTSQVYHRAALHMVRVEKPVDVLEFSGLQLQSDALQVPSWVPDWKADLMVYRPLTLMRDRSFNAGGRENGLFQIFREGGGVYAPKLGVRGFHNHNIVSLSDVQHTSGTQLSMSERLHSAHKCFVESKMLVYTDPKEAFSQTLLYDDYSEHNPMKQMTSNKGLKPICGIVMDFLGQRSQIVKTHSTAFAKAPSDREMVEHCLRQGFEFDEVTYCLRLINAAVTGRRLAVTDTGYLTLLAERTEVGESVAFFLGVPVPFAVRMDMDSKRTRSGREEIQAKLVGDCYVHGMMEGEAIVQAVWTKTTASNIILY